MNATVPHHPAPTVRARTWDVRDPTPPATGLKMWRQALATGWEAELTYALGVTLPTKQLPEGHLVHSAALRIRSGHVAAYASWICPVDTGTITWVWSGAARAGYRDAVGVVPVKLTLAEFKDLLSPATLF